VVAEEVGEAVDEVGHRRGYGGEAGADYRGGGAAEQRIAQFLLAKAIVCPLGVGKLVISRRRRRVRAVRRLL
jgi:hypothetical protein